MSYTLLLFSQLPPRCTSEPVERSTVHGKQSQSAKVMLPHSSSERDGKSREFGERPRTRCQTAASCFVQEEPPLVRTPAGQASAAVYFVDVLACTQQMATSTDAQMTTGCQQ